MEPMDLDDSSDHHHHPHQLSSSFHTSSPGDAYPRCQSVPNFSPLLSHNRVPPRPTPQRLYQTRARTLSSPAIELSPATLTQSSILTTTHVKRQSLIEQPSFSFDGTFHSPAPRSFSRGATPVKERPTFSCGATPVKEMPVYNQCSTPVRLMQSKFPNSFSREATPLKELFSSSFAREGTPAKKDPVASEQSAFGFTPVAESVSGVSMETSDRSDVSEMEVSQLSPAVPQASPTLSPSGERVRSAFSSFSLFGSGASATRSGNGDDRDGDLHHGASRGNKEVFEEPEGHAGKLNGASPWEPALTTVQAATTFKRAGRETRNSPSRKKDSPAKSGSSMCTSPRKTQPLPKTHSGKSETSTNSDPSESSAVLRRLGAGDADSVVSSSSVKLSKTSRVVKPHPPPWITEDKVSSRCACCVKAVSVFVVVVAVLAVVLIQLHDASGRSHFAAMDAKLLRNEMESKVFGQSVALDAVPVVIERYLRNVRSLVENCDEQRKDDDDDDDDEEEEKLVIGKEEKDGSMTMSVESKKRMGSETKGQTNLETLSCRRLPLVLSFHGWTGVGKNFVSDIITGLFAKKTVTKFLVPYHFPHRHLDKLYQKQVERWILTNVTKNHVNFFVFDEMDKATPGIIDGLYNAISSLSDRNTHDSAVIFLLLSNSFATAINQRTFQALKDGHDRQRLSIKDFADLFDVSNIDSAGDEWYAKLKSSGYITLTIPFLPLEEQHVVQCIRRDLVWKKLSTHSDIVGRVLKELSFTKLPGTKLEFSQTGCKRVSDKVDLVAFEHA